MEGRKGTADANARGRLIASHSLGPSDGKEVETPPRWVGESGEGGDLRFELRLTPSLPTPIGERIHR